MANQTLTSGKANEVINLLVRKIERLASGGNNRFIEAQPPLGPRRIRRPDRALDATKYNLASGTALPGSHFVETPVERDGNIQGGADCLFGHQTMISIAT